MGAVVDVHAMSEGWRKVEEDGDAVDSRTSSWALSSFPEVDEVVEDCVTSSASSGCCRRRPRDVRRLGKVLFTSYVFKTGDTNL